MGRGRQREDPVPPQFLRECFAVGGNSGHLLWRRRPKDHFPQRAEDHASWNAKFAGKPAGFVLNGQMIVRVQWRGKTRQMLTTRVAWIVATGSYPKGMIEARNGDETDLRPSNLIETQPGRNKFGGISRLRRDAADAAVLTAMRDHPGATLAQISRLVGSKASCTCVRLARLQAAGLTCGPACVARQRWSLAQDAARPSLDSLDRLVLVVLARGVTRAAPIARRLDIAELTAARRLKELQQRGFAQRDQDGGWRATGEGLAALGDDRPTPWVAPLYAAGAHDVVTQRARSGNGLTQEQRAALGRKARGRFERHCAATG